MAFHQELHVTARTREIESIFQDNKADIKADFESLELTIKDLSIKWGVQPRNIRRWMDRLGIDAAERLKARRVSGYEQRGPNIKTKPVKEDGVRNPKLLSMRW